MGQAPRDHVLFPSPFTEKRVVVGGDMGISPLSLGPPALGPSPQRLQILQHNIASVILVPIKHFF